MREITQYVQTRNIGLLSGSTGVAFYLYHCSRAYADASYADDAMRLIYEIQDHIDKDTSWSYAEGLAGIGSAISYLIRNGFIDAEADYILSEFDSLFSRNIYHGKHTDMTRDTGLIGIGYYLLNRISNSSGNEMLHLRFNHLLLLVMDILFARLEIEGYTYPYAHSSILTAQEVKDCKRFLRKMSKTGLCPELTGRALSVIEQLEPNEEDVFAAIENQDLKNSKDRIKVCMIQLFRENKNPIVTHLAALQLKYTSLPPWWELF